jgi:MFS family permease
MLPPAMSQPSEERPHSGHRPYGSFRTVLLGVLAFLTLVPVTLPVTVLRELVQERFGVSELLTSLFMSINMVGAILTAPLAGALADRFGRRRALVAAALLADAALLYALTLDLSFRAFMALRFLEGGAHIFALSLILSLASQSQSDSRRGRAMGVVGAGLTLGVALGAPIGGVIGRTDPLRPLLVGSAVVAGAALLAALSLREVGGVGDRPSLARIVAVVRRNRVLLAPLAFAFADRFTVGFYTTTFSLYLSRIHDLSAPHIGALIMTFMLPFALLSYPLGRLAERRSPVAMVCGGSLAYGVGTALVAFWPAGWLPALMLALGIASAVMFVPSLVLTTDVAPPEVRGTALGAFNAAGSLGFVVGPATGGFVSESVAGLASWETGYRAAFAVAGVSEIACVAVTLPLLARLVRGGLAR